MGPSSAETHEMYALRGDEASLVESDHNFTVQVPQFKLGIWSTIGIVLNRVIGTGIFTAPATVLIGTGSPAVALIFWAVGGIYALAASHLYIEFGLNVPRYVVDRETMPEKKEGIPRSGGELNYLQYLYGKPGYLSSCLFGVPFILFGNMAANGLAFGQFVFLASGYQPDQIPHNPVRGIAIAIATFACTIHQLSPRGGIYLSNIFALIKVVLLLFIIITWIVAAGGGLGAGVRVDASTLQPGTSFTSSNSNAYGYAEAFLSVCFAYDGWNQANYVLGEIKHPRKTFVRGLTAAMVIVIILYMLVNTAYIYVDPINAINPAWQVASMQKSRSITMRDNPRTMECHGGHNTTVPTGTGTAALIFFDCTYGALSTQSVIPRRLANAFMAVSSFGNIIVNTFTSARVKQELAKEGVIPFPSFFASGYDMSWRRWIKREPANHARDSPAGALVLHWCCSVLLIFVTWPLIPAEAYRVLANIYSYLFAAFFPTLIGLGMLWLRLRPGSKWASKTQVRKPKIFGWLSIISALVVVVAGLFIVVVEWIPPTSEFKKIFGTTSWFVIPTVSWAVLGFGLIWWVGMYWLLPATRPGRKRIVEKAPQLSWDEDGYWVLELEVVTINWVNPRPPALETPPDSLYGV